MKNYQLKKIILNYKIFLYTPEFGGNYANVFMNYLPHTPSSFLKKNEFFCEILNWPAKEKPLVLIPEGYAAKACFVSIIERKKIQEVIS